MYFKYWGKASKTDQSYHLLPYHCLDVAAVGSVLLHNHYQLLSRIAKLMGIPNEQAKRWCVFLLGLHDLGKFAESFQQLRDDLRGALWSSAKIQLRNYGIRHDSLGMMLWMEWMSGQFRLEYSPDEQKFISNILPIWLAPVFGHHGWPPKERDRVTNHFKDFDREAALGFLIEWVGIIRPDFSTIAMSVDNPDWKRQQKEVSWLIAGLAVLCDWLGSNQEVFRFYSDPQLSLEQYWHQRALPAAEKIVHEVGVLPNTVQPDQSIENLFPHISMGMTPLQKLCSEIQIHNSAQLFVLEDVTGAGKTEAAMILAYRLMQADQADGVYIGLPTMATANAMYERMIKTYRRLYSADQNPSLILSHSARHLSDGFRDSVWRAQGENSDYDKEENISAQCNRWLADNRKKALLADVGIGTIDQALMAVMPARHQSLRLIGLLNKVLILDEIHAYDPYTREPLKKLIRFHSAFGGSTVLLSATLTEKQRRELIQAFDPDTKPTIRQDYPLLTHASIGKNLLEEPVQTRKSVARQITVEQHHEVDQVIQIIRHAVKSGQCVCWIRNTVSDAREAWYELSNQDWVEEQKLHLFHSRFTLHDRLRIEKDMLNRFGKSSTPEEREGRVLIATQVVEQSLDLDFDVMVSDLAPIDLLIQRAGRLHRHQREERGQPVLYLYSPEPTYFPQADWYKAIFPKANYVYPHTLILWRSARILEQKGGWEMPESARELLEYVYDEAGEIPDGLQDTTLTAIGEIMGQRDSGQFASLKLEPGYAGTERWDEDAIIATRLGEETHAVYLARWQQGKLCPWIEQGAYRWDLSSLRVNKNQLSHLGDLNDQFLAQSLETLREQEKLFDEYSFILPMVETGASWFGHAKNARNEKIEVKYHPLTGMEMSHGK